MYFQLEVKKCIRKKVSSGHLAVPGTTQETCSCAYVLQY